MKVFDHFNDQAKTCPMCGTKDDKKTILVGLEGTREGKLVEAIQVHLDCLPQLGYSYNHKVFFAPAILWDNKKEV